MRDLSWPADLRQRRRRPELMDQPDLDEQQHVRALHGLARLNFWSGSVRILWPPIRALLRQAGRPLRILDIASGAGDVPIGLWRQARRAGMPLTLDAWDVSPRAVAYARARAEKAGAAVQFLEADAIQTAIPREYYDVVTSSLFLHHLAEEQAHDLLQHMAQGARRLVLINDLIRSYRGYLLAYLATRLLSASPVVHTDGPRSVEGAFTVAEAQALAERAGLPGARIARRWPCRFLLTWERP